MSIYDKKYDLKGNQLEEPYTIPTWLLGDPGNSPKDPPTLAQAHFPPWAAGDYAASPSRLFDKGGPLYHTTAAARYGIGEPHSSSLPVEAKERKKIPLATGCFDYFPRALRALAALSLIANEQHNPGEPLHWSRDKSSDHPDCLARHFLQRGQIDTDKTRHSTKVFWRAAAILELELEEADEYGD